MRHAAHHTFSRWQAPALPCYPSGASASQSPAGFIGIVETLGGLGLLLPGLLGIRPGLTPLAAAGLVIIMIGATAIGLVAGDVTMALIPVAVGLLAALVAYGRWRLAPHRSRGAGSGVRPGATRA